LHNTFALDYAQKTVVVVDDHSTDQTVVEAHRFDEAGVAVLQNTGTPGKNTAVALALRRFSSELVCVTDADVLVPPDALGRLVEPFADPLVGAACGVQRYVTPQQWEQGELVPLPMTPEDRCSHLLRLFETRLDSIVGLHGQFLMVRRILDSWVEPGIRCDDVEVGLRVRAKGLRVVYIPATAFFDLLPSGAVGYYRQRYRRGQAVQACLLRHRAFLFNSRYGWFGWVCFPLEFFLYVLQPIVVMAMGLGGGWMWIRSEPAQAHTWLVGVAGLSACLFVPHLRRYVAVNAVLLWGLIALLVGQRVSDRWDTSLKTTR
jgi:cellulose synthase/poly-beta-1,6-N-acetylglucosamine synthase-like glycosyltransferase